jgi:hypothetical protein
MINTDERTPNLLLLLLLSDGDGLAKFLFVLT